MIKKLSEACSLLPMIFPALQSENSSTQFQNTTNRMQRNHPVDLFPYFLTLDDLDGPIDWERLFGNDHPVEIDIGCGRGMFLVNAGEKNPDRNYLGLEIDFRAARHGADRLQRRKLDNVKIIGCDATLALDKFIPHSSVEATHVYFPDPWWKKKHRRRRIFTDRLINQMVHVLKSECFVHSWTDVEEYFGVIFNLMSHDKRFITHPTPIEKIPEHELDYLTSFEMKKRKLGSTIYRGLWQLKPEVK